MFDNTNTNDDECDFYPIKGNYNVVRLPISGTDIGNQSSITFDRSKSLFSIANHRTCAIGNPENVNSEITTLFLDGNTFYINLTYNEICKVLFR